GSIVWTADYEPFGQASLVNPSVTVNLRLPGQYFDAETGLHYNVFRDYDPSLGRYIESDPIGLGGGLNTYAYVLNDPVNWVDPLGLVNTDPTSPFGPFGPGGGGGVGAGGTWGGGLRSTPSPALRGSPYHPDVVANRIKPPYQANPAHDPRGPLFNPKKTPEPADACSVYSDSVRGGFGVWYGEGTNGEIYRFFSDNAGTAHFSGIVPPAAVPNSVLDQLGI
ncbi:RHS repeat-associated core domain-containing protein, partial [Methylocaldum sp. BRCS4]|nr:RHS repeat-associated core domain-containing protein [Methylocaldum sp. BRCS4]